MDDFIAEFEFNVPLFICKNGDVIDALKVRHYLKSLNYKHVKGKPLIVQLQAASLYESFLVGTTPYQLPYTLWS